MNKGLFAMRYFRINTYFFFFAIAVYSVFNITTFAKGTNPKPDETLPKSGRELYRISCAACHGSDGRGAPASLVGFEDPLPDFTDCNFSTREAEADWVIVAQEGGPARGFSEIMPAFGDALSETQIKKTLRHIRTFSECDEWPPGELNLPRALYTTKAFPEDEIVFHSDIKTDGPDKISNKFIYERRIGPRNQIEVVVPFGWNTIETGVNGNHKEWSSSLGDLTLAAKRVLFHSMKSKSIFSAGGEVILPTGDEDKGFGNGTTVFEPYLAYGKLLSDDYFIQLQSGLKLPYDNDHVQDEVFWKMATGRSFAVGRYGSIWAPMVEILGSKNIERGNDAEWDLVPQLHFALNKRQHVRLTMGVRLPLNHTDERNPVFAFYLLWDTFDGGFFEGW
jgi:mono/diheme cytochrome c family protein